MSAFRSREGYPQENQSYALYITLTATALVYGSEIWSLATKSVNIPIILEWNILRRIYGPVKDNGQWRIRYNKELYEIYGESDLVTCIN
jgi:hypothetical protein